MTLLRPLAPEGDRVLARRNPLAKLLAAATVGGPLLLSIDPLTPALLLAVELLVLPLFGVRARTLLRRLAPVLLAAAGVGVANAIVTGSLTVAATLALRVLAVVLPGVLVLATTDPVDLADALVQLVHAPARFAYGSLAALRLLPLLSADWHAIARARRARGVEAGRNPLAHARLFTGQVFTLLVTSIRRGVRLAAAMDARGFDSGIPRTFARRSALGTADALLVAGTVVVVAAACAVSVRTGYWQFVIG